LNCHNSLEEIQYFSHNKPIVITDNHLACHIPNDYPVLLIHQGCALTTSERNPDWMPYWRDLCCNGQKKMLSFRDPKNTWIISCSKSCTHDFRKFYPILHTRFKLFNLLHPSELNENNFKSSFNQNPVILGNCGHMKKGKHLIPRILEITYSFCRKNHIFKAPKLYHVKKNNIYIGRPDGIGNRMEEI